MHFTRWPGLEVKPDLSAAELSSWSLWSLPPLPSSRPISFHIPLTLLRVAGLVGSDVRRNLLVCAATDHLATDQIKLIVGGVRGAPGSGGFGRCAEIRGRSLGLCQNLGSCYLWKRSCPCCRFPILLGWNQILLWKIWTLSLGNKNPWACGWCACVRVCMCVCVLLTKRERAEHWGEMVPCGQNQAVV